MDYELAKKLKDAGFPQKTMRITDEVVGVCAHGLYGAEYRESCDCTKEDIVHFPTLSELIKECGKNFGSLTQTVEGFCALKQILPHGYSARESFVTPEEACANLYLQCH